MTDKIKYSITTSDGKTHEVSKENLDKYGIKAYAESYKGATIRMRDTNGADYDIPLEHYDSATGEGLHAFSIAYSTHTSQAQPQHPEVTEAADDYERRMSGRMPAGWGWRNLGTYGMGGKDLTLPSDAAGADMTGGAPMGKSDEEVGREVAKATAGFMERSGETVDRVRRMAERHTPEGKSKARMVEQRARAMGLDTKLSGLVAPMSGGRGPVPVGKDAPAGAERYGESPQVHDVVMRDGRPAVEWQMQDGSLTSDRVAAEQEEYAQRGARMARETEKRLREEEDRLLGEELDSRGAEARGRRAREYEEEMANAYKRGEDEGWMNYFFRVLGHNPNTQTAAVARGTGLYDDSLQSEEANRIEAEIRTLEEAKKLYDAQHLKRGDGLWDWQNVVNFTQGVRDVVGDVDTYAGGTREAHRVMQMLAIKNKVEAGEELSDADFRLAEAMMLSQKVAASGSTPHGYNAGKTTAEMGRFMIQMAMNPTGNLGRALGTKAFRMLGEKGAKAWAGRIVGTAAGDVASSVFLANTLQAPTTLADAGERHIGEVVTDKDGNLSFVGGDGLLKAFGKAQGAAGIENYTEMLGGHLGIMGKYIGKGIGGGVRRLPGGGRLVDSVSELATKIGSTDWARGIANIESKVQWSGPVGEMFEEEAGIVLNSIFVGDNKLSDLTDLDQQIDIALGVGLFGGFVSGVKSVGYPVARRRARSRLNTQDGIGRARFGDKWEEIRTAIDSSEDAEVSGVVSGLVNEYAESPMQARTVADYALALMKARGYNLADSAARGDGSMSDEARSVEDSYERGYETRDAQSMNDLKRIYERERSRMASSLGEDDAMKLDAETDMVAILERFRDDEGLRDQAQAYVDARKAYEGMIHRVRDDIDSGIAGSDEEVNLRTNRDTGAVHPAIIRSADGNKEVYVVSGSVVMMDDGVTVDSEKSDKDIIIRDAETGEARFAVAQDVVSLGEAVDAETEKRMAQERIRTEMAREAADRIDGVLQFVPGDVYNVSDGSGGSAEATVVGPVVNNDGSVVDGWVRMRYADGSEQDVPKANIEQSVEAAARERVERYAAGMGAENPTEGVNMTEKGTPEDLESEGLGVTLQENQANIPNSENGNGSQQDNGGSIGSERTNAGKGMAVDAAGSVASNRDRGYIRVYEAGLSAERDGNSGYGERARRNSEAERLIGIARQQGQYIDKSVFDSLGKRKSKPGGESVVYINQEQSKVYKVKDPAAKSPMKGNVQPEDVIYEHLVHNKYFPETAYGFEGIGDELGDVRIVLSQDYVDAVDNATDEQIETALAEKGLYPEGNYRYGNDEISVTDVTGDNALVGADGKVYFIDPVIDFKKPVREILPEEDTSDISDVSDIGSDSEVSESALSRIPVDERTGVPMFEQVDADTAWDGVVGFVENEDDAKEYADSMVEQLTKDVATAEKNVGKVKAAGNIAKFKAEKAAARQALADAQARLEHWTKIAGVRESRITEAQRQEAEAERLRQIKAEQEARQVERQARDEERASRPGEYAKAMSAWEEPSSLEERILRDLAGGGIKLRWSDRGKSRGLGAHLFGGKNTERRWEGEYGNYKWLVDDNTGLLPEEYAERLAQDYYNDYENDSDHYTEVFGAVLDVLGSYASSKDMWARVQELHQGNLDAEAMAEDFERMEMEARGITEEDLQRDRMYREQYGMSEDEWDEFYMTNGHEIDMSDDEFEALNTNLSELKADEQYEEQRLQQAASDASEQGGTSGIGEDGNDVVRKAGLHESGPLEASGPEGGHQEGSGDVSLRHDEGGSESTGDSLGARIAEAEATVNTTPSDKQKEAGNYKKGHVQVGTFDVTIENPKGSTRKGVDPDGTPWETTMTHTYGYIRGTKGVDGDHIDVYISSEVDGWNGRKAFVVDQYNPDGTFDEHKVMIGFNDRDEAFGAYLSNYESGWEKGRRLDITEVNMEDFEKWIESSKRKTKPFAEYKNIKALTKDVDQTRTNINNEGVLVDGEGKPLTLYHGTPNDVESVTDLEAGHQRGNDDGARFNGDGVSFTPDRTVAEDYAHDGNTAGKVFEANVRLSNPYYTVGVAHFTPEEAAAFTVELKAKGHDGIINYSSKAMRESGVEPQEVIVFGKESIMPIDGVVKIDNQGNPIDESESEEAAKASDEERADFDADMRELQNEILEQEASRSEIDPAKEGQRIDDDPDVIPSKEMANAERDAVSTGEVVPFSIGNKNKGNREVYEAAKGMLEAAGVRVHEISDEEAQAMLGRKKETPVAGQPNRANEKLTSGSVLTAHSGGSSSNATDSRKQETKIINDTQSTKSKIKKYNNGDFNIDFSSLDKTFGSIGSLLSMRSNGGSRYTVLRTDGGNTVAIRLSDHGANGNNFRRDGADENLSIVIERRKYDMPDSEIEFTEAVIPLAVFESRSQDVVAAIVSGVDSVLKDGEFTLPSDLGSVGRKGGAVQKPRFSIRTYHGTGADFDAFDFSHVGEGEGAQAYGWGGYVTEVKGIGRTYATNIAGSTILPKIEKAKGNIAQVKRWLKDNSNWEKYSRRERKHQRELEKELKAAEKAGNEKDAEFYRGLLELQVQNLVEDNHRKLIVEKQSQIEEYEKEIYLLEEELSGSRHLYTVRIPDDKGWNYLDWDKVLTDEQKQKIGLQAVLEGVGLDFYGDKLDAYSYFEKMGTKGVGFQIYMSLVRSLGSDRAASEFLSRAGMTGIKYPADYRNGGRGDGKNNYVLFDEGDMKITDHVRFLRDGGNGTVFGWTVGGEVWLNGDAMNPETPLHEYTHLWDAMVRRENPELWARGVELMKQTPVWDEVVNDPNYSDIRENEDEVASEVHARLTGERGAEILERMIDGSFSNGPMAVAEAVTLVDRLKGWLREMFKALKETLEKWSSKDLSELTAEEFADMTLRDLAEGLNPGEAHAVSEGQEGKSFDIGRSIEKFKRKYNSAEIVVVKDAAGLDNEDISQESRQGIIEDMEAGETCGLYCRDNGKIYIFAGLQPSITKLYHALLHENIHAIMHRYGREIERELVSFRKVAISSINDLAELYEGIRLKYEPTECDEEFFAFVMPLIVLDKSWRNIGKQWAHDENVKKAINFITLKINNGNQERIPQEMDEKIDGDDDRTDRGRGDGSGGVTGRFQGQGDHHGSKAGESGVTDSGEEGRVRFHAGRRGKAVPVHEGSIASEVYEKGVRDTFMHRLDEGWHDYLRSVRIGQEAIEKETGRKLEDSENAYLHALHKSSVDRAELDRAEREVVEPLMDAVRRIRRSHKLEVTEIERYMNAKHGPERNRELARRDAVKAVEDSQKPGYHGGQKDFAEEYAKNRERDYSGLTALFDPDGKKGLTVAQLEAEADKAAAAFEAKIGGKDTAELWLRMKALTDRALEKSYTSGRLSKEMFTELSGRWQWYVPLRGFREQTADDVYDYIGRDTVPTGAADRKAAGRTSEAGDILANAMSMLNSAIVLGNKNEVKQKLLNLALKGETRLLSVSHQWYEKLADGTWQPSYPQIKDGMSADEIRDAIEKHDGMMEVARKNGMAKRKTSEAELPVRTGDQRKTEQHAVRVSRNGVEYLVWVNGNPKLAQAVNGLLNFDADKGKFEEIVQGANRRVARNVTALNPDFLSKNFMRDIQNSAAIMAARCGWKYVGKMEANLLRLMGPIITNVVTAKHVDGKRRRERPGMAGLYGRYFKNALDMSRETDRLFSEFMRNGGETGYSQILRPEDYRKRIGKHLRKDGVLGMTSAAGEAFFDSVEVMNRCVENAIRFSAYMTSRQSGKSILRSIEDAKEASVNFNRKGSGAMGNRWARTLYIFVNPAVQGVCQYLGYMSGGKTWRIWPHVALRTVMGAAWPLFASFLYEWYGGGDGDDDDDGYFGIPAYKRRGSLSIPLGDGMWAHVPMTQEQSMFFGIGETVATHFIHNKAGKEDFALAVVSELTKLQPVDFVDVKMFDFNSEESFAKQTMRNLTPTGLKYVADAFIFGDDSFTGRKISRANEFNTNLPEWRRADDDAALKPAMRWLNEKTGGGNSTKGWLNWNPDKWEYALTKPMGGLVQFPLKVYKSVMAASGDDDYRDVRNYPIAGALVSDGNSYARRNRMLIEEVKWWEARKADLDAQVKDARAGGVFEEARVVTDLFESGGLNQYEYFHTKDKERKKVPLSVLKDLRQARWDAIDAKDREKQAAVERELVKFQKEMVEKLRTMEALTPEQKREALKEDYRTRPEEKKE